MNSFFQTITAEAEAAKERMRLDRMRRSLYFKHEPSLHNLEPEEFESWLWWYLTNCVGVARHEYEQWREWLSEGIAKHEQSPLRYLNLYLYQDDYQSQDMLQSYKEITTQSLLAIPGVGDVYSKQIVSLIYESLPAKGMCPFNTFINKSYMLQKPRGKGTGRSRKARSEIDYQGFSDSLILQLSQWAKDQIKEREIGRQGDWPDKDFASKRMFEPTAYFKRDFPI